MSQIFDQISQETPEHVRTFVDLSFKVADKIQTVLMERGMQPADLAKELHVPESTVGQWLSGTYDFTLTTICKISSVLQADMLQVDNQQHP